jgi:2-keto-4-pentenoate hydratase
MCRRINKRLPALFGFVVIALAVVAPGRGDDKDGFRPLFNGNDLEGWEATKPELWSVKDGMIIGKQERGQLKKNSFLATKEKFSDFRSAIQGHRDQGTEIVDSDELRRLAIRQLADFDARTPGQLFSQPLHMTPAQAYALQTEVVRLREQRGEKVIGYKIGCTSKVIQRQLGVDQPIFGRLFATECFRSGARLSYASYANLAVEGELAVRLAKDLSGPNLSQEECPDAIAAVFPVIELHHYVLHEARSAGPELIASNGMHAGFVLAEESPRPVPSDLVHSICIRINGVRVGAVEGSGTFASASESLRWLAGRLARIGLGLGEGQIILTGSPMPLFPVSVGSKIVVEASLLGKSWAEIVP